MLHTADQLGFFICTVIDEKGRRHVAENDDNVFDGEKLSIARYVQILLNQIVVFFDSVGIDVGLIPQIQQ